MNISEYAKQYNKSADVIINNLNNFLSKLKEGEKDIKIQDITEDLIEDLNQLSLNNISYNEKNKELVKILNEVSDTIKYKIKLVDKIIKIINESYNNITIEELTCDEKILYYECKKSNDNINNKNKKGAGQNESERFYNEWTELKRVIINTKRKYNDILNEYSLYKKYIFSNKNLLEQNSLYIHNIIENSSNDENNEKEEISNDMKLIIHKIENSKNYLYQIINHHNDAINSNQFNINYKQCENAIPNLIKIKTRLSQNANIQNELDEKINDMKTNYLLLKTLPSNYESYTKYISQSLLEQKNKILEDKMKLIFGEKFNVNNLYNETKPEIIWDEKVIPKLTAEIMILRENKTNLENDLNALNLAFNLALQGNPSINDSQLIILFRIKEENKLLKKELKKIKEKNNALQEKIKKIIDENIKDKNNKKDEIYDNNYTININNTENNCVGFKGNNYMTLGDCSLSEIKENNIISNKGLIKQKNIFTESKDSSILNDISNGFTPKKTKKKHMSVEKK